MNDPRVEAAVKAWDHHWGDRYGDEAIDEMGEEVKVALEAADQADSEAGIHRVKVDAATVERVAEVLHYAAGLDDWTASNADERGEALSAARAVLAALTGVES